MSHANLEIDPIFDNLRVSHMGKQFQLLLRKRVYPYEYLDDWEKLEENHLPFCEAFYSKLSLLEINECDYDHAQRVWRVFGMKNLDDYHL